jgi:hypothetical protein
MDLLTSLVLAVAVSVAPKGEGSRPTKPVGDGGVAGITCGCFADLDQSGSVDGADLAALLGAWGTPTRDLDGDGTTNGADLSIVLGSWGPCFGVPANDLCSDPLPIVEGDTPFCTVGAGTEVPPFSSDSSCTVGGYDSINADVWYAYTAPATKGKVTVSTCGATWDTRIAVYANFGTGEASCPTGFLSSTVLVACNDDAVGCGIASETSFSSVPNQVYMIRVGGYVSWVGEGTLQVRFEPEGSSIDNPIFVGDLQTHPFIESSTLDRVPGNDDSPCALGDTVAEWFVVYIDPCDGVSTVSVSTCNGSTDFDTTISMWKKGGSDTLGAPVACNDDSTFTGCQIDGVNRKSRVDLVQPAPGYYYVRVSGYLGAKGNYGLQFLWDCD